MICNVLGAIREKQVYKIIIVVIRIRNIKYS